MVDEVIVQPQQAVEAPVETPTEQTTARERTTPKFIDEYVPGALRPPLIRPTAPTAPPSWWEGTKAVMDDSGFASNVGRVFNDYNELEDQDFHVMQAALPSMLKKYDLHETWSEQLLLQSKNTAHMETLVKRIQRVTAHRQGAEAMGIPKMLATEIGGFVLDPTNFIPGTLVVKGAALTGKALPKVAAKFASLHGSKMGTMGIYAAFGAAEEAIRLSPRLMSDPTYNYEQYLMEVGMGAVFAGAIPAVPTAYRWGKSKIGKNLDTLNKGLKDSWETYGKSVETRTGVNVMKQAVKGSRKAAADKDIKKAFNEVDTAKATREAKDSFNEAQTVHKVNKALYKATEDTLAKLKVAVETGDEAALLSAHADSMRDIIAALPKADRKMAEQVMDDLAAKRAAKQDIVDSTGADEVKLKGKDEKMKDAANEDRVELNEHDKYDNAVTTLMRNFDQAEKEALRALDEVCK